MPVSFQQIRSQIKIMGPDAIRRQRALDEKRALAEELFLRHAADLEELERRVELASLKTPELRCALPAGEALNTAHPVPALDEPVCILAADGSQINPDRHEQVEFGVINTGAVRQQPGAALDEFINSLLLFGDGLQLKNGPMTEEYVALLRDVSERTTLADLAEGERLPVVTLSDGPLELFRQSQKSAEYDAKFDEFLAAMHRLAAVQAVTAGYVDRPRSDLLVRLLELMIFSEDEVERAIQERPLRGVTDAYLFSAILGPGQRSASLKIHSSSSDRFPGELALHFFYLNAGSLRRSSMARVEIPAWVAEHPILAQRLHAVLVAQVAPLAGHPYPYLLHRAHEVAVVGLQEKQQISGMIAQELISLGLPPGEETNKQIGKDQMGDHKRYQ